MLKNGNPPDDWPGLLAAIGNDGVSGEDIKSLIGH